MHNGLTLQTLLIPIAISQPECSPTTLCKGSLSGHGVLSLNPYPIPGFSDPISSLSHLIGAGVFAVLGFFLVKRGRGQSGRVLSLVIFSSSCVLLLSISGVYHLLDHGSTARAVLRRLDHAAIFVFIAGSFTPIHAILFKGIERWGMLALVWMAAIAGVVAKTVFFHSVSESMGLAFYLGFGWLGALSGFLLWRRKGLMFVKPGLLEAGAYTIGAVLEFSRFPTIVERVLAPHELFHLAVLVGMGSHWWLINSIAAGDIQQGPQLNER
jgi:channel protein (hemolysin III family)